MHRQKQHDIWVADMKSEPTEAWMQLPTSHIRPLNRLHVLAASWNIHIRRSDTGYEDDTPSAHTFTLQVNSVLTNVHCSIVPSSLHCRWAYHTVHMTGHPRLVMIHCCVCTQLWVWTRQNSSGAETDRSPLDFSKDERGLVPGFNFEYVSGSFALLFLSKYD